MRDWFITAAGALLALVALAAILLADHKQPATRPTSVEPGPNGYLALRDWLHAGGVATASHRQRLASLATTHPENGDLFITTMPHQAWMHYHEFETLRSWVSAGNTLLVLAALNDTPDWSMGIDKTASLLEHLQTLTGMAFEMATDADGNEIRTGFPARETIVKLGAIDAHPLAVAIDVLEGVTDSPSSTWQATSAGDQPRLRLAVAEAGTDAIWQIPHGRGRIFVVALGSLLTNRVIGRADNRVFIANLVRHHLAPGGTVIFDDMHQGLSSLYDPSAFFSDPRLYASLAFVIGLWFVYIVGTWNRLAPARQENGQPRQQDFIRAVGGFLARKLNPVDAGRLAFASWFAAFEGRSVAFEEPPWRRLDANPALDKALLAELKADHARLLAGRKVNLKQLHNRIRRIR